MNPVYAVYRLLPEEERPAGGLKLLESGLSRNPYNFLLTDAAQAAAGTPQAQIQFWQFYRNALSAIGKKPGCPAEGLYNRTVKSRLFKNLAELPVPQDAETAREVLAFLQAEQCDVPSATVAYRVALEGLSAVMDQTAEQYKQHLTMIQEKPSRENDLACTAMAATIKAVAGHIKDRDGRKQWALALWTAGQGREKYFGHRYRVATEPSLPYLARVAGQKMPAETELMKTILDQVASELEQSVASERNPAQCRQLASKIAATGRYTKDAEQRRAWFESLTKIMAGNETFSPPRAKENADPLHDPCSDTIQQALASLQTP